MSENTLKRVLLVEDDELISKIICRTLSRTGFEVLPALTGQAGLAIVEKTEEQIDLVILDMILPDMSGNGFLARLSQVRSTTPVVLTSGDHTLFKGHPQVKDLLSKPFSMSQLIATVSLIS